MFYNFRTKVLRRRPGAAPSPSHRHGQPDPARLVGETEEAVVVARSPGQQPGHVPTHNADGVLVLQAGERAVSGRGPVQVPDGSEEAESDHEEAEVHTGDAEAGYIAVSGRGEELSDDRVVQGTSVSG